MTEEAKATAQVVSRRFRIGAGLYFGLTGVFLLLSLTLGAPSFWYWACGLLWLAFAIAWFFEPVKAAAFSLPPVMGIAIMMRLWFQPLSGLTISIIFWIWLAVTAIALALILFILAASRTFYVFRFLTSFAIIVIAFSIDKRCMNQLHIITYQMTWSTDGYHPWGYTEPASDSVTAYRHIPGGYCYLEFHSADLKKHLLASKNTTMTVTFNQLYDFDAPKSYNVRSVDGILLQDENKVIKDWWIGGGEIETGGVNSASSSFQCP